MIVAYGSANKRWVVQPNFYAIQILFYNNVDHSKQLGMYNEII